MYDGYDVQSVSRPIVQFGHLASRSMTIDNIGFANIRVLISFPHSPIPFVEYYSMTISVLQTSGILEPTGFVRLDLTTQNTYTVLGTFSSPHNCYVHFNISFCILAWFVLLTGYSTHTITASKRRFPASKRHLLSDPSSLPPLSRMLVWPFYVAMHTCTIRS